MMYSLRSPRSAAATRRVFTIGRHLLGGVRQFSIMPLQNPVSGNIGNNASTATGTPSPNAPLLSNTPPTLVIKSSKYSVTDTTVDVLASVSAPEELARAPADICCVVDVSGSMSTPATFQNAQGIRESYGLSVLDVVKHAVKTVAHSLGPEDRLSVVVYNNQASVLCDLTFMTPNTRDLVVTQLDIISPNGSTNLWDGLHTGLELLRKNTSSGRVSSLFLLTDGYPNVAPPRGEMLALKDYIDKNSLPCAVHTFGFGYDMNSNLLDQIAIAANGMYSFIPDSSFVGTVFINSLANSLVAMTDSAHLAVAPVNGASLVGKSVLGSYPTVYTSWGAAVDQYTLHHGQSRDTVFSIDIPRNAQPTSSNLSLSLKYKPWNGVEVNVMEEGLKAGAIPTQVNEELDYHKNRLRFVDVISEAMALANGENYAKSQDLIAKFATDMVLSPSAQDPRVQALLLDLKGQVTEALTSQYYHTWGKHYLPSLRRAHQLQISNNFKDPGVQFYGGDLFRKTRDEIEKVFVTLPPPKPSLSGYTTFSYSSMGIFHNSGNPCFDGECVVALAGNTTKYVKDVKKGDSVVTPSGVTKVLCVVKSHCKNNQSDLVVMEGGLKVTPYHPIRIDGKWCFPCDMATPTSVVCPAVYSFVLESEHVMIINDVECVGLGHNFTDDAVVQHPYFGSQRVIEDLQKADASGFENGVVEFEAGAFVRDKVSGLVCGLEYSKCIRKLVAA